MTPLQKFVSDPSRAQSRPIGSGGKVSGDFFLRDGGEGMWWPRCGVRQVGGRDRFGNDREEPGGQDFAEVCVGCHQRAVQFEEWGNLIHMASMAPGGGLPKSIHSGPYKEVIRPTPFGLSDGAPK